MKRRGSALVYVIIVVFSITSVVLIGAKMSSASERSFQNAYREAQFKTMADGAVSETISMAYKETMTTGPRSSSFTTANLTTNATQHPTMSRAYKLDISGTIADRPFSTTRVVGKRLKPNPAFYGLWVNDDYSDSLLGTVVNGSAYMAGNATLSGPWNVTEDFLVRGTTVLSIGSTVAGTYLTGVRQQTMPDFRQSDYAPQSTPITAGNQSNFTFTGVDGQGKYPTLNRTGNLTMSGGTLNGKGTVYVDGNLNINANYNYATSDSRVVFLVKGNLNIGLLTTQLAGTYIVLGHINVNSLSLNLVRGNLCTDKQLRRLTAAITVTQDDTFIEDSTARVNHRLPGYYP